MKCTVTKSIVSEEEDAGEKRENQTACHPLSNNVLLPVKTYQKCGRNITSSTATLVIITTSDSRALAYAALRQI